MHFAVGYTGNGVGPSHLAGRILARSRSTGQRRVDRAPLVDAPPRARVPPEPLRWLGGTAVLAALKRARGRRGARRPRPTRSRARSPSSRAGWG